jgi:hypothetical protein
MTKEIYQLQIVLNNSNPKIWRRILVYPDTLLVDLHRIIQTVMGWTNSHLHLFSDNKNVYSPIEFEVEGAKNSRLIRLSRILKKENEKILYEYDFGDGWEHDIILEKILMDDNIKQIPKCVEGERNCPPEDCGGIGGYENLLETISNPKNEEYEEIINWLGAKYDPDYFNRDKINKNHRK